MLAGPYFYVEAPGENLFLCLLQLLGALRCVAPFYVFKTHHFHRCFLATLPSPTRTCLPPFIRTHWADPENPGESSHLKILNVNTPAKSPFLRVMVCSPLGKPVRSESQRPHGGRGGTGKEGTLLKGEKRWV